MIIMPTILGAEDPMLRKTRLWTQFSAKQCRCPNSIEIQSWLGQQKDKEKQKNGASAELAEFEGRRERRTLSCSS